MNANPAGVAPFSPGSPERIVADVRVAREMPFERAQLDSFGALVSASAAGNPATAG